MATGNRTLKLSILADVDDLKKKLGEADKAVEGNASKISDFGKKAAAAFAIAAAAAVAYGTKLAIDGVKAAIEDEQAQLRLANALREATGATDAQIKATEDYILKTSLATGVSDDELRPAMQRLAVSTKSTTEAQKLMALALDISKGSGKDLTTVANALGKAHDGQETALARLGIGLSQTELKTMTFTEIQQKLADLYGGAASANAETFQGKMDRVKIAFDEAKESLGNLLLPYLERLADWMLETGIPTLEAFIAGLSGNDSLSSGFTDAQKSGESFGKFIDGLIKKFSTFITFMREAIGLIVELANQGIRAHNYLFNTGADIPYIGNPSKTTGFLSNAPTVPMSATGSPFGQAGGNTINISVQSVDSEGAARAVAKVLNNSASRSVPQLYNNGIKGN
jgi:hypothetical protein